MSKELEALKRLFDIVEDEYWGCSQLEDFRNDKDVVEKKLKALEIIKECLVSEFKLYEENGKYFILFYFDEIHQLIFQLKGKEEYDLLKEV